MSKKQVCEIVLVASILVSSIVFFLLDNANILFGLLIAAMVLSVSVSKISIFSIISIFMTYICVPVFFQYNFGVSYGVLGMELMPLYAEEIYISIILFNIMIMLICEFTNILKKETELFQMRINYSKLFCYFCCFVVAVFSIVKFPRFGGERFDSLLPGEAWNHFVLAGMLFLTFYLDQSILAKVSITFAMIWFLLHGERVDMLGYLIFLLLFILKRNPFKFSVKRILTIAGFVFAIVASFITIGIIRGGADITIKKVLYSFIVQPTAADVAYVYNSAIHFSKTETLYYGITYFKNLGTFVPLVETPYLAQNLLNIKYHTPGGEFYFCESVMNFGLIVGAGVTIFASAFVVHFLLNRKNIYIKLCTLFCIAAVPRILWYGKNYVISGVTIFIPCILLVKMIIENISKKRKQTTIQ